MAVLLRDDLGPLWINNAERKIDVALSIDDTTLGDLLRRPHSEPVEITNPS